jgi:iron-sulfur cluster assembly protein
MINVTDIAKNKFLEHIKKRGRGQGVRLGVKTTGCSGLAYVLEFVDSPDETDISVDHGGLKFYVDPKSMVYLDGLTVDFQKKGLNEGFEFINPNEKDRCGCGESFRI